MLELMRPMLETMIRHGLTALATLLLAAAASNPYAQALVVATGMQAPQIVAAIVGVGMAVFALIWSLLKNVKFQQIVAPKK